MEEMLAWTGGGDAALSIRSYHSVIEGCLTDLFLEQGTRWTGVPVRLKGVGEQKRLVPAWTMDRTG